MEVERPAVVKKSFRRLFETISQIGATGFRLEVHSGIVPDCQDFAGTITSQWPQLIPPGRRVSFFRWKEEPQGEQLHRRMILADRGGLLVEAGLESEQCVRVRALSPWQRIDRGDIITLRDPNSAGPDEYIVMGDNRWESEDSRDYGPIRRSCICGRVTSSTSRFHQSSILRR